MAMEYHLTGSVIEGGLKLDTPVPLADGTRVRVTIRPLDERAELPPTQPHAPVESSIEQAYEIPGDPNDSQG